MPPRVNLPDVSEEQAAAIAGKSRMWIRDNVDSIGDTKRYNPKVVVEKLVELIRAERPAVNGDDVVQRKKLAEARNAEDQLRMNQLKIARLEGRLMPVDWVQRMLDEMADELRKPIEIIGRKHPEYAQMVLNGLDSAADKVLSSMENGDEV